MNFQQLQQLPNNGSIFILTGPNGSGKTRALTHLANNHLNDIQANSSHIGRLICLSGTVLDRFPRLNNNNNYAYFGRRTNTNMFSEISPYRHLTEFLLTEYPNWEERASVASSLLKKISLDHIIIFKFRRGRNQKEKTEQKNTSNLDLKIDLSKPFFVQKKFQTRRKQVLNSEIHVSKVLFTKNNKQFEISDLSSGERSYALAILTMAFSVIDSSIIFYDEPENSLHPKWQESIIRDLWSIISKISSGSKLIIATHSPLIVASAKNNLTYIFDLISSTNWVSSEMFGNTSDTILKEQFNLTSPRSMIFIERVRECLKAMINIHTDPQKFIEAADLLISLDVQLDHYDPFFDTLEDIKNARNSI